MHLMQHALSAACSHVPVVQGAWVAQHRDALGTYPQALSGFWKIMSCVTGCLLLHTGSCWCLSPHCLKKYPKAAASAQTCCETSGVLVRGMIISVCMCDGPVVTLQNSVGSRWEFFCPFCDFGLWLWRSTAGRSLSLLSTPGKLLESSHWVYSSA